MFSLKTAATLCVLIVLGAGAATGLDVDLQSEVGTAASELRSALEQKVDAAQSSDNRNGNVNTGASVNIGAGAAVHTDTSRDIETETNASTDALSTESGNAHGSVDLNADTNVHTGSKAQLDGQSGAGLSGDLGAAVDVEGNTDLELDLGLQSYD